MKLHLCETFDEHQGHDKVLPASGGRHQLVHFMFSVHWFSTTFGSMTTYTGASVPAFQGIHFVPFLTNSSMMEVDFLPDHLVIVGEVMLGWISSDVSALRERSHNSRDGIEPDRT